MMLQAKRVSKTSNAASCCKHNQILNFPNTWKAFCPLKTSTKERVFKRKAWILDRKKDGKRNKAADQHHMKMGEEGDGAGGPHGNTPNLLV